MNNYRDIIIAPVITEKTESLKASNIVVFKVAKSANKTNIKQAVEAIFGVKVLSVNTLNTKPKKKRVGRYSGMTKSYKKAIVKLSADSKLEIN